MKATAGNIFYAAKMIKFVFDKVQNIVEEEGSCWLPVVKKVLFKGH